MQNKEDCMAQLDCNVKSCCHNEDNCCCLSSIEVNGSNACNCEDTCCGSYFEDKSGEKTAPRHRMFPYRLHVRQPTACITMIRSVTLTMSIFPVSAQQPLTKPSAQLFRKSRKISAKCRFIWGDFFTITHVSFNILFEIWQIEFRAIIAMICYAKRYLLSINSVLCLHSLNRESAYRGQILIRGFGGLRGFN